MPCQQSYYRRETMLTIFTKASIVLLGGGGSPDACFLLNSFRLKDWGILGVRVFAFEPYRLALANERMLGGRRGQCSLRRPELCCEAAESHLSCLFHFYSGSSQCKRVFMNRTFRLKTSVLQQSMGM